MERMNIYYYRPLQAHGIYELWVSGLFETGTYRCSLYEECDNHTYQMVDVDLRRHGDRRWFENYVKKLLKQVNLKKVLFGNGGCVNDCHYTLTRYKEIYGSWKRMEFINDLSIPEELET